jgi:hypothetical protein
MQGRFALRLILIAVDDLELALRPTFAPLLLTKRNRGGNIPIECARRRWFVPSLVR